MTRTEFISHLQNNTVITAMYNYFKEKVDVSMPEFMNYLLVRESQLYIGAVNDLMENFITENMIKFNIITVLDKNGKFISYV